ncbi:hypothetical protein GCM10009565_89180 [Amycolatopsis albidoflavus]
MSFRANASATQGDQAGIRRDLRRFPKAGPRITRAQGTVLNAVGDLTLETARGTTLGSVTAAAHPAQSSCCPAAWTCFRSLNAPDLLSPPAKTASCAPADTVRTRPASSLGAWHADLTGDVVFMSQPGEEGFDGTAHVIGDRVPGFEPVVVVVEALHAGTASNVIPDDIVFDMAIRSFSPSTPGPSDVAGRMYLLRIRNGARSPRRDDPQIRIPGHREARSGHLSARRLSVRPSADS